MASLWKEVRRLNNAAGSTSEDTIYSIGTMISGTDRSLEDSISGYTPIVIDRRGNRRFHGAFTGGFNAGYFNTVGSAQGYKAKYDTWTSSKSKKNTERIQQTPMDFMDEEDMATNTNLLTTSRCFDSLNRNQSAQKAFDSKRDEMTNRFGDKMSGYLMVDQSLQKNEGGSHTKGIELLIKCGWRMGKNIGSNSSRKRLKLLLQRQDELLMNSNHSTGSMHRTSEHIDLLFGDHILGTNNGSKSNDKIDQHDDDQMVPIYRPRKKTDCHGIGFDEENRLNLNGNGHGINRNDSNSTMTTLEREIESKRGQKRSHSEVSALSTFSAVSVSGKSEDSTFGAMHRLQKKRKLMASITNSSSVRHGLSALEDTEIGDDIYGDDEIRGSQVGYNRFINDGDDDDDGVLMKDKDRKAIRDRAHSDWTSTSKSKCDRNNRRHPKSSQKSRSRDGTLPIDGFVVSSSRDHSEYSMKNTLRSCTEQRRHSRFDDGFDGMKRFQSGSMQIHHEFLSKFADIDLSVGSFLCRAQSTIDGMKSFKKRKQSHRILDESSIPRFVPDAQRRREIKHHQHSSGLSSRFVSADVLVSGEKLGGLSAGLTLSSHLKGPQSEQRKGNELLKEIRDEFGTENADQLLRFDIFLADKLCIESPIENAANFMMDDGTKTQFELKQEQFRFEAKWKELKPFKEYLYRDKPRIHGKRRDDKEEDGDHLQKENPNPVEPRTTAQNAAKQGLYGALTRSEEMWIPDKLLCKRCNLRHPFQGMYRGDINTERGNGSRSGGSRFGASLLEKAKEHGMNQNAENKKREAQSQSIEDKSKGELVAAMLGEEESNDAPPTLQLKQLKTWNAFLNQKECSKTKNTKTQRLEVDRKEMKSFLDGVLGVLDEEGVLDEDDNHCDGIAKKANGTDQGDIDMTLFKSIFDDHSSSDSDSESEAESENESASKPENGSNAEETRESTQIITATMPPPKSINAVESNEDDITPKPKKRLKFIAKSERQNVSAASIGIIKEKPRVKNKTVMSLSTEPIKTQQLTFDAESDVEGAETEEAADTVTRDLVWTVVDSDSSSEETLCDRKLNEKSIKVKPTKFRKRNKRRDRKKKRKGSSRFISRPWLILPHNRLTAAETITGEFGMLLTKSTGEDIKWNALSNVFQSLSTYHQRFSIQQITGHVLLSASCLFLMGKTIKKLCNDKRENIPSIDSVPKSDDSVRLKLMSFNVRNALLDVNNSNVRTHWKARRSELQKTLKQSDCDIIGTQEGILSQLEDIHNDLNGEYSHYGSGRLPEQWYGSSTNGMNEHCSIFWKRSRFRIYDQGTFWLSETPNVPGSFSWNAPLPRIASWSLFRINEIAEYEILFVSTHLGLSAEIRRSQIVLISKFVHQMIALRTPDDRQLLVFVVGDFNEGIKGSLWNHMFQGKEMQNVEINVSDVLIDCISEFETITGTPLDPRFTFHDFKGLEYGENEEDGSHAPIDWILCSKNVVENEDIQILDLQIITESESEMGTAVLPSDHYPVMMEIEIRNKV